MADRTSVLANCKRLSLEITQYLQEPPIIFENFYDLFHFIIRRIGQKKLFL
ncbi:hypothetical protein [Candidatus Phytoplasma fraxini]|uniref:Uncharacterized protein n=1 Tax=Ash yellows phytoplasma TaxID=35780 RepID=A0ABZ2UA35_ASHYP